MTRTRPAASEPRQLGPATISQLTGGDATGRASIRLHWLAGGFLVPDYPTYLAAYFALIAAGAPSCALDKAVAAPMIAR